MTLPPSNTSSAGMLPNNVASLLVEPTALVSNAAQEEAVAAAEYASVDRKWRRRLFIGQCGITAALILKWLGHHPVVAVAIMALLIFLVLTALQLLAGLFTVTAKRRMTDAQAKRASARQSEVEHNLASLDRGRYRWTRQSGEYLAVFTDAGLLYHFGAASGDRHWMLDARRAVRAVRVVTRTATEQTAISVTKHGRRRIYTPTRHVGVLGKGRSTTTTTTQTTVISNHVLEIQVQTEPGTQPTWIAIQFGTDLRSAEDWKLLVDQLRS